MTFNTSVRRFYSSTNNNKPWFGLNCHRARKKYNRTKRKYHESPTNCNKRILNKTSKQYKHTINFYVKNYKFNKAKKLRLMSSKRPKYYWKFLNGLKPKSRDDNSPTLHDFYDYYKNINSSAPEQNQITDLPHIDQTNLDLNSPILESEIEKLIKNLKNGKACSPVDSIINEYLKHSKNILLPLFTKHFNCVLDTGFIPEAWVKGVIIPVYKNKGDPAQTQNYRPITILSCLGKLFTSVLNKRLTNYIETNNLLNQNQAGFRSGFSCQDHIFTLYSLVEILKARRKKLFCAYVDFSAAFDRVHRASLWQNVLNHNINGKIFQVIYNMYSNIKSCVSLQGSFSAYFDCQNGVRQGENLSPLLFALFLNDMQSYIESNGGLGIELNDDRDILWLKLLILLYADDTVILSDTAENLQSSLNAFHNYCTEWQLNVNINKTKIIVFGARNLNGYNFYLGDQPIDITSTYHYLGVTFSATGSFLQARKHISQQARKATYLLFAKAHNADLPVDLTLKLFDHTVLPILTYGSEIFGFENLDIIEKVHNEFLRKLLKVRKSTPLYMIHGELGRYPIYVIIKSRMIQFWSKLFVNRNKISFKIYNYMLSQQSTRFKWVTEIKSVLDSVGLSYVWQQNAPVPLNLHKLVKQILIDQYTQQWNTLVNSSNKGKLYHIYKESIGFEAYLKLLPLTDALSLFKFRTANHKLPIETGRWDGTLIEHRKCSLCQRGEIGTERHYLLSCDHFNDIRSKYLPTCNINLDSSEYNYKKLMQSSSPAILSKLVRFMNYIMFKFNS